ncbi:MAG TPA: hypothetical protein VGB82_08310 [Alphaproteobacteria bacterium]
MTAIAMIAWDGAGGAAANGASQQGAVVTIAPAAAGTWRVSTNDNWFGGLFVSCKAAIAFALGEARRTRCAQIVIDVGPGRGPGG